MKFKVIATFIFAFLTILAPVIPIRAESLEDQLRRINQQLQEIQNQKNSLQQQLNNNAYIVQGYNQQLSKLYGEVEVYKSEIQTLQLQIDQLQVQMQLTDQEIQQKELDIKDTETSVANLEKESENRIKDSYVSYRMYGNFDDASSIFNVSNINLYFKESQYKEIIQTNTNDVMVKLAELKQELQDKKAQLDLKLIEIKQQKETVDIKKVDLDKKKDEADVKIAAYYASVLAINTQNSNTQAQIKAFSLQEIQTRAQAELLQQQIFNELNQVPSGTYVLKGKFIGIQGCTGLCTGEHLHFIVAINGGYRDPCAFLAGGVCGYGDGSSVTWPLDNIIAYTSAFGNRCFDWGGTPYCDFHTGIDIVGPSGSPVFAAHDGYLFKGVDGYGANYAWLCQNTNCKQGLMTGYWHLRG